MVEPVTEPVTEEVEYVKKTKKPKNKKRVIVVEESSSSENEIEVRLPKRKTEHKQVDHHFERGRCKKCFPYKNE